MRKLNCKWGKKKEVELNFFVFLRIEGEEEEEKCGKR